MKRKKRTRLLLRAMTTRVGIGSCAPSPENKAAKVGMTFYRIMPTTAPAITTTATG